MRLKNQFGYDVLEGVGQNRSNVAPQVAPVVFTSTSVHPWVHESDSLTLVVDNTLAASAQIQVELLYAVGM